MVSKPRLSASQIFGMCVRAFGIQFGFALPQANATRIFQNLGANLDNVPLLWLAGPITVALPYAMLANNLPSRKMGVSIGLAQWDGSAELEELVHTADAQFYRAKRAGRNQVA